MAGVAGGRVKQRRLAQALTDRPEGLRDGRSPGPRVVADLLIALRHAGAAAISDPVCAGSDCGKPLRRRVGNGISRTPAGGWTAASCGSVQRRGQDWYCAPCDRRPEPCGVCGKSRPVAFRNRSGRPQCAQCPVDEPDPVDTVSTGIEPGLNPEVVAGVVHAAATRQGQRHQLAWELRERPNLLTGAGADAVAPCVLRLIDLLVDAGAQMIGLPACPRCRRRIPLHRRIDGQWRCLRGQVPAVRRLRSAVRALQPRRPRPTAVSDLSTAPTRRPANLETCITYGRNRPVGVRTPDGPLCQTCRPWKTGTCSICGQTGPCLISKTTGQPWCHTCKQRWARCSGCANDRPIRGGTPHRTTLRPLHPSRAEGIHNGSTGSEFAHEPCEEP